MQKKPSEWTPQEAWEQSAIAHLEKQFIVSEILPFPADPPEVVTESVLQGYAVHGTESVQMMARELLARREAERKA